MNILYGLGEISQRLRRNLINLNSIRNAYAHGKVDKIGKDNWKFFDMSKIKGNARDVRNYIGGNRRKLDEIDLIMFDTVDYLINNHKPSEQS